jgi:hypothetical protein
MTTRAQRSGTAIATALVAIAVALPRKAQAQTEAPEVPDTVETQPPAAPLPAPASPAEPPTAVPPPSPPSPPRLGAATSSGRAASGEDLPLVARPADANAPGWSVTPGARLDVDAGAFHDGPSTALLVRRARLQATGWIGPAVYFSTAVEYAAPPGQPSIFAPTDVFVAAAPLGPLLTLQAGQFDTPFTLENRTVDSTLDFLERSIAIRDFAVPENKDTGAMLTGTDDALRFHYAVGVFNGDGPTLRSLDDQFDVMARAWLAPFAFTGNGPLRALSIGGSIWAGDRANALPLDPQTTSGGLAFARFDPYTTTAGGPPRQLRQVGRRVEAAAELEAPLGPRYGARAEIVWRWSPLSEEDVTNPAAPVILGAAHLDGWAAYGQAWLWVLGDERSAPIARHGLEPFVASVPTVGAQDGLMLALRVSHIDEEVWQETDAALLNLGDPAVGVTQVTSLEVGANYWHARAFRATCNYVLNRISGTTAEVKSLGEATEHELLLRLAIAL